MNQSDPEPGRSLARLHELLQKQLRQGLTSHRIALAIAIATALAVFPLIGATTLLCTAAAVVLRLNQPIVQAINFGSYPLQLALIVPFWRAGEWIFGVPISSRFALSRLAEILSRQPGAALTALWSTTWHGVVAWVVLAPLGAVLLYVTTLALCQQVARRMPPLDRSGA
jgi:uncharacterized protein (DUF2062 family)